jgi:hypothetical protein
MGHPFCKSGVAEEIWGRRAWCALVENRDEWGSRFRTDRVERAMCGPALTDYNLHQPCDPFFVLRCWRWCW